MSHASHATRRLRVLFLSLAVSALIAGAVPSSVKATVKSDFAGVWQGQLSNLPFELTVWETSGQWNATISFNSQTPPENLEVSGWKETPGIFYFFRPVDVACISMFKENGVVKIGYFEQDVVRTVTLTKQP
jgi:hypothetical protein